jgi:2-polyprenyl-3-methyl-5-hydroxy-6-metoxy-1,4-benzoquinol methylase
MKRFKEVYLFDKTDARLKIMDLGSTDICGCYRPIFDHPNWEYIGLDLAEGKNVDLVLSDPYSWLEIESGYADVFISGQTFEHIEYFWRTMLEIARILKPGGICCIIAPSGGPEHRHPVDCWRFFPDGFKALARYARLEVLEASVQAESQDYPDGSDDWADTLLVAKKPEKTHTKNTTQTHIYRRVVDENSGDSLSRIIKHIRPETAILELGPATGYFTEYLKNTLHCVVDCVEVSTEMADAAKPFCRNMVVADLDAIVLEEHVHEKYDYIIIADVLEHVKNTEKLLRSCRSLLNENGRCLVSVPNIAHAAILGNLFRGKFEYVDEGLLDRGHLRFFTRSSILSCLKSCGLDILSLETVDILPEDTEIGDSLTYLPHAIQQVILNNKDTLVYQFIVEAAPSQSPPGAAPEMATPVSPLDLRKAYIANLQRAYLERIESLERELSAVGRLAAERLDNIRALERALADERQTAIEHLGRIDELNKIANERLNAVLVYENHFRKLNKIPFSRIVKKILRIK